MVLVSTTKASCATLPEMRTREVIETTLKAKLQPTFLEVFDMSHTHNVPEDAQSHFKVVLVSEGFVGKPLIARHRSVNSLIDMGEHRIHALEIHAFAPEEWDDATSKKILGITNRCHSKAR